MEKREKLRIATEISVKEAAAKWDKAPLHIKAMAAGYVNPILVALVAINDEVSDLKNSLGVGSKPEKAEVEKNQTEQKIEPVLSTEFMLFDPRN